MDNLKTYKLEDLGFLGRGKSRHRPRNDQSLFGGKYPFIQTGEVKSAEFYINSFENTYNGKGLKQSKLWEPGTLLITIAANIAETAILDIKACFPDSILGFIPDEDKADVRFIKYYIDTIKLEMQSISRGTTQDNLSLQKLRSIDFNVPPVSKQKRVADVLTAFDDLIANNKRRIEILEEMARRIYRKWFVHFRYPGHENDELVDSGTDLGEIPEGWSAVKLGEVLDINKGKNITKKTTKPGEVPVVAGGLTPAYTHDTPNTKHPVITVSASGANAGYVNLYEVDVWASDCSYVDLNATTNLYYYYSLIKENQDKIFHMQHGSAQPHVYPKDLKRLLVVEPVIGLKEKFEAFIKPTFRQRKTLMNQNKKLKETRDLLLPKLITGKVEVGELTNL